MLIQILLMLNVVLVLSLDVQPNAKRVNSKSILNKLLKKKLEVVEDISYTTAQSKFENLFDKKTKSMGGIVESKSRNHNENFANRIQSSSPQTNDNEIFESSRNRENFEFSVDDLFDGEQSTNQPDFRTKTTQKARTASKDSRFAIGNKIKVKIKRFGKIGASVEIVESFDSSSKTDDVVTGMILNQEIEYLNKVRVSSGIKDSLKVDDIIDGYILYVRNDGKLDISTRLVGYHKIEDAREKLLQLLEVSPTHTINLGDKSSPEDITKILKGVSKAVFKGAVGALLREDVIVIYSNEMMLKPVDQRQPKAEPYTGKTPRGWKPANFATVFVGNIPYTVVESSFAKELEKVLGFGKIAKIKLATEAGSGRFTGYGYVSFYSPEIAADSIDKINTITIAGRQLIASLSKKSPANLEAQYRVKSLQRREASGQYDHDQVYSIFVGNLNYDVTDGDLKEALISGLERVERELPTSAMNNKGILEVRIMRDPENRSRGFAYVDLIDESLAKVVKEELNGMMHMGWPLKIDLDGLKKRNRDERKRDVMTRSASSTPRRRTDD